jgi:hypothetical protein
MSVAGCFFIWQQKAHMLLYWGGVSPLHSFIIIMWRFPAVKCGNKKEQLPQAERRNTGGGMIGKGKGGSTISCAA